MLIAILLGIFLSSGSTAGLDFIDAFKVKVKNSIPVSEQNKVLLSLADDFEDEIRQFAKQLQGSSEAIKTLNKDYGATREDFETVLHELNARRARAQEKIVKIRFEMKNRLAREEWNKIFSDTFR